MLYIPLRESEYVMIGNNIKVSYEYLVGNINLMLGFEAPDEVPVLRGKLYEEQLKNQPNGTEKLKAINENINKAKKMRQADRARRAAKKSNKLSRTDAHTAPTGEHSSPSHRGDE